MKFFLLFLFVTNFLQGYSQTLPVIPSKPKAEPVHSKPKPSRSPRQVIVKRGSGLDSDADGVDNYQDNCPYLYGPVFNKGCPLEMEALPKIVTIQGGEFHMGSNEGEPDEKPMHSISISSFKIGKYEVTVKEFAAFVQATGYETTAETEGSSNIFTGEWKEMKGVSWRDDETGKRRPPEAYNHPVVHISWTDATAYCGWLSRISGKTYRLPTEAEWEYAAGNGGPHTKYSWGNNLPESSKRAGNVADETTHPKFGGWTEKFTGYNDGYFFSAPVGSFAANDLGLYDMSGNVWEWCGDWYGDYNSASQTNPVGPASGESRVIRGGCWEFKPALSRVAYRNLGSPDVSQGTCGFRVVSSL